MTPSVVLIEQPDINFTTLLTLGNKLLGYSISTKADQSGLEHSDTERLLSCLASFSNPSAPAGITPNLLSFVQFAFLIAADERDMIDILQAAAGMPFVTTETIHRGQMLTYITGNLAEWRDAVKSGASQSAEFNVRALYCQIMSLLTSAGHGDIWHDFQSKPLPDNTFYLEDKKRG